MVIVLVVANTLTLSIRHLCSSERIFLLAIFSFITFYPYALIAADLDILICGAYISVGDFGVNHLHFEERKSEKKAIIVDAF